MDNLKVNDKVLIRTEYGSVFGATLLATFLDRGVVLIKDSEGFIDKVVGVISVKLIKSSTENQFYNKG